MGRGSFVVDDIVDKQWLLLGPLTTHPRMGGRRLTRPTQVLVTSGFSRVKEREGINVDFGAGGGGRRRGPTAERELQWGEGFGSSEAAKHGGESILPREALGIRPSLLRPPAEFEELRVVFHLSLCMCGSVCICANVLMGGVMAFVASGSEFPLFFVKSDVN
ncbi:hypothetical protein Acr_28g0015380 [Actinidia rufa]|uniref:Uncharacterized protein n=1 Tax=Actinidia rufa TaxID=165716 RepID=A0A7J0HCJ6_9ERIC|nr:hypothetical protein Acr_28g0015380 [Actinidia rufa]